MSNEEKPGKIMLKDVRISFPDLFHAKAVNAGDKPKYGAQFLIPKDSPIVKAIMKEMEETAKLKWGNKAAATLTQLKAAGKTFFTDGDLKGYEGYEGHYCVSARNVQRPTVINRDKSPVTEEDGVFYSGCRVNAIIYLWAQDNNYGKRINATLSGVQFFADAEAFSGGPSAAKADEFETYGDAEVDI